MNVILLLPMLMLMAVHFKTSNVKGLAITWGIISLIFTMIIFFQSMTFFESILLSTLSGVSAYVVAWSIFSLANYFEESIFLRLFVLVTGMFALMKAPFFLMGLVIYAYQSIVGG